MSSDELKIVFAGPMGAGKTTAIRAISDVPPVSTEVSNSDRITCDKEATTVALDFGQLQLPDGTSLRLYGTPGQDRFAFMWDILCRGSLGVILLVDGSRATATADLLEYAKRFHQLNRGHPLVVGVGRIPAREETQIERFADLLAHEGIMAPVHGVDVRRRDDVLLLVETLLCILEARVMENADELS